MVLRKRAVRANGNVILCVLHWCTHCLPLNQPAQEEELLYLEVRIVQHSCSGRNSNHCTVMWLFLDVFCICVLCPLYTGELWHWNIFSVYLFDLNIKDQYEIVLLCNSPSASVTKLARSCSHLNCSQSYLHPKLKRDLWMTAYVELKICPRLALFWASSEVNEWCLPGKGC